METELGVENTASLWRICIAATNSSAPVGPLGGLVFKAHGLLYHSTLGLRVIKKKKMKKKHTTSRAARSLVHDVL